MAASAAHAQAPPVPAAAPVGAPVAAGTRHSKPRTRAQKDARNKRERLGNISPLAREKRNKLSTKRNYAKKPETVPQKKKRRSYTGGRLRGKGLAGLGYGSFDQTYATLHGQAQSQAQLLERAQAAEARLKEAEDRAQAAEERALAAEACAKEARALARKFELKAGATPSMYEMHLTTKGTQTTGTGTTTEAEQPGTQTTGTGTTREAEQPARRRRESFMRQRQGQSGLQEHPQKAEHTAWQKQPFTQDLQKVADANLKARIEKETDLKNLQEWLTTVGIDGLAQNLNQLPSRSELEEYFRG